MLAYKLLSLQASNFQVDLGVAFLIFGFTSRPGVVLSAARKGKGKKEKHDGDTEHERMHCKYACLLEDVHTRMQHNAVLKTTYRYYVITQRV